MAKDPVSTGDTDPSYWESRFDKLEAALKAASKTNAAAAATKVVAEAHRAASEVKLELKAELLADRAKLVSVSEKLDRIADALVGIQNAKLIQQGIASLALAVLLFIGFQVVFG